jgi:hypothetical protein
MAVSWLPTVAIAAESGTVTVENEYIKVTVNRANGGYTISTLEGDILKKSDNNKALTHRGEDFDTSFTSFQIAGDAGQEYVFGNDYGLLGWASSDVATTVDSVGITSTWSVKDLAVTQRIELISGNLSEQLGTAMISYTVKNNSTGNMPLKSRVLMDTQLGENDFGYYEVTKGVLGAGYNFIDSETTLSGSDVPADYFVKDAPFEPDVAAFGVNSTIATDKPYQMTFAHWANLAGTKFDYAANPALTFSNALNAHKTADSAVALYYNLGTVLPGAERSFSTLYGVTANLKNKDNQVLINTTAPAKLLFNEDRTAYIGSGGAANNLVRINSTVSNPILQAKSYKQLAVVVYAIGFTTQRQTDSGSWITYDNADPLFTKIVDFTPGENITTFFDFKFEPRDNHELGTFVTKVFDTDPAVNALGVYADDYLLGETTNYIFIPARDPALPTITLHGMEPQILYNDDRRFLTVSGRGMTFFKHDALQAVELRGESKTYPIPLENLTVSQDGKSVSLLLETYMEPGRYGLHFLWNEQSKPASDIPADLTSSNLFVHMTSDESYRNDKYGVLTVQRNGTDSYTLAAYQNESAFAQDTEMQNHEDKLLFVLRGELIKDNAENKYRMAGKDKDININQILNYHGSDFEVTEDRGTVKIAMNGKITTIGANTTVRKGSAAFTLKSGTKYVVPVYDSRGAIVSGASLGSNEDYIDLAWDNSVDALQTIGGFLIDLKFGLLGKMRDGGKLYNIISFGGGLDLSFMTPGGAKAARENKSKDPGWDISTINDRSGLNPIGQPQVVERAPTTKNITNLEFGAQVHDVLYGQNSNKTGYLGINMDAHMQLPQIVSFLPSKMAGDLHIVTIGGYEVGVSGKAKTTKFDMAFSLVIKSNPSGAPIPDKLYFAIGGFEPGINVDGAGVLWVTGGGGGFDNLYETIYGTDGLPPFKLLLNVQFDIFKIMTGSADFGLSLRSFSVALSKVSLKMMKDAKFLDGGGISATWYPNYELSAQASINFLEVFKGHFSLFSTTEFFEMMMRIALTLPDSIPVVGGMEIAAAELGGSTEKMWGNISVLGVGIGIVYWWDSGDLDFKRGKVGPQSRAVQRFNLMTTPQEISKDAKTGKAQYMTVGSNLSLAAGSVPDKSVTPEKIGQLRRAQPGKAARLMAAATPTTITANAEQNAHIVTIGEPAGDYILTVARADGGALGADFAGLLKIYNNGEQYPLKFYKKPNVITEATGANLTEAEKQAIEAALAGVNANVVGDVAYIAIPRSKQANPQFLVELSGGGAYDVGAVHVAPLSRLDRAAASVNNGKLGLTWAGADISDTATISVAVSDEKDADGVEIAKDLPAKAGAAEIALPGILASGDYYVTVILSDEEKVYQTYQIPTTVTITDAKAPTAPLSVSIANAGNNKLRVNIGDDFGKDKLEGYYVDIYEDGTLIEAAVYYSKEQAQNGEILIGGRYDVPNPKLDADGKQMTDTAGNPVYEGYTTMGFAPGKSYRVKVRAGSSELDKDGAAVYHYSRFVTSATETLREATPPVLSIAAVGGTDVLSQNTNTFALSSSEAAKGTLTVNGADGVPYVYDTYQTSWTQEMTLEDGVYTLEFAAEDEQGDKSLTQLQVSVDTTAPNLMLESPLGGDSFTDNKIIVKGVADSDALYTFKVDGAVVGGADRDMSAYFTNGILEYTIALGNSTASSHTVEILAKDAAGNLSSRFATVSDSSMPDIVRVELYRSGAPIPASGVKLSDVGNTASLQLMGVTASGDLIDVTDNTNVAFAMANGSGIGVDGNVLTANSEGNGIVMATFDLGGGFSLSDAVMVTVGEEIIYYALTKAIADAESLNANDYTAETWANLEEALTGGKVIKDTGISNQEIINSAAAAIVDAIANLKRKPTGLLAFSLDALKAGDTLETTAHYTNASNETVRGHLIVAFYGGQDGPCLRVVTEPFTAAAGSTVRVVNTVVLPAGVETQYVKAFLWDDALTPLGEALALASQPAAATRRTSALLSPVPSAGTFTGPDTAPALPNWRDAWLPLSSLAPNRTSPF